MSAFFWGDVLGILNWFWFAGRVSRRTFSIVVVPLILLIGAVLYLTLTTGHGGAIGLAAFKALLEFFKSMEDLFEGLGKLAVTVVTYGLMVLIPLYLWICLATAVKRFHDRNKSGWRLHLLFYPELFYLVVYGLLMLGVFVPPQSITAGTTAAALIALVAGIWFFIELALFPGTEGPNRYGPEPRK